jgi:hypothetical protein
MKVADLIDRLKNFNPGLDVVIFTDPRHRQADRVTALMLTAVEEGDYFPIDLRMGAKQSVVGLLTTQCQKDMDRLLAETPDERMVSEVTDVVRHSCMDGREAMGIIASAKLLGAHFPLEELRQVLIKKNQS